GPVIRYPNHIVELQTGNVKSGYVSQRVAHEHMVDAKLQIFPSYFAAGVDSVHVGGPAWAIKSRDVAQRISDVSMREKRSILVTSRNFAILTQKHAGYGAPSYIEGCVVPRSISD